MSSSNLLPRSILDTDLYKLSMQQAVWHHFPDTQSSYKFTLRDKSAAFTTDAFRVFQETVDHFGDLELTEAEHMWLEQTCPYLTPKYLSYLRDYRFKPTEQVHIKFVPTSTDDDTTGLVEIEISGLWAETIMWEVPLMACLSEVYFTCVVTDWNYDGQKVLAYEKGRALLQGDCVFSEFGTRRRRSFETQDIVVEALVRASKDIESKGKLSGTSNVHLAHKYGITPVGTIAHEWFMGVAALKGYENANSVAMDLWEEIYGPQPKTGDVSPKPKAQLIALTDTFSSAVFFKSLSEKRVRHWQGLRQDSGDPFVFATKAARVLREDLRIDPREKMVIFSDSLNIDKALRLKKHCDGLGLSVSFGIGTFFTNDFRKTGSAETSKALNMVIKLSSADGRPCVKISDDLTKNTGDPETVQMVKKIYDIGSE